MPRSLRIVLLTALGVVLAAATLAGLLAAGVATSMGRGYAVVPAPAVIPSHIRPDGAPRIPVAVLLGSTGSVATDALAPFGVLAASSVFEVYTVSVDRAPVALSGGLTAVPDYSVDDVDGGVAPAPEIVIVPAMVDPSGEAEAPLRRLIERADRAGATVMSVCAGARVLAATEVLDGKRATSFWSDVPELRSTHPETDWDVGVRWVEDGNVITTAGVWSGVAGALHLVEKYAGMEEAQAIAQELGYTRWKGGEPERFPVSTVSVADYPYALGVTLPWFQPAYGLGLTEGVDEIAVAAAAELYAGSSFLTRIVPVAEDAVVATEHGMTLLATPIADAGSLDRIVVPGRTSTTLAAGSVPVYLPESDRAADETSFDPVLRDIARQAGAATVLTTAKYVEYPVAERPYGKVFPVRLTILAVGVVVGSVLVGAAPAIWVCLLRRRGERRASRATTG